MARKKKAPEHENLERWLVSYADFITLLFAFFVVMYSISSVNEGKYRVLSDSLVAAFRAPTKTLQPIQVGQSSKSPVSSEYQIRQSPFAVDIPVMPLPWVRYKDTNSEKPSSKHEKSESAAQSGKQTGTAVDEMLRKMMDEGKLTISPKGEAAITEKLKKLIGAKAAQQNGAESGEDLSGDQVVVMKKIASEVQQAMQKMIDEDLIAVRRSKLWVEVEIKASVLFASGDASVNPKAIPVLMQLAHILKPFPNVIRVEGFTDNVPIKNSVYPSNWELSSGRAASVVRLFINHGIAPTRLLAVGYGKYHPIADNDTAAGRRKNRRVVLVVLATRAKVNTVKNDLQGKSHDVQASDAAVEDKGIQTPEEVVNRVQEKTPPAAQDRAPPLRATEEKIPAPGPVSGTDKEPPSTQTTPSPKVAAPAPHAATKGVVRRPPVAAAPQTGSAPQRPLVIPPPIQVRPPISLAPPLLLPVPAAVPPSVPLPGPTVESKP